MLLSQKVKHAITPLANGHNDRRDSAWLPLGSPMLPLPRPILTKVVAEQQHIEYVKSRKRPHAGIHSPDMTTLRNVALAFDGQAGVPACPFHPPGCDCNHAARAHTLWTETRTALDRFLEEAATLTDVAEAILPSTK